MDKRIFGLENEYGVTCTFREQKALAGRGGQVPVPRVVSWAAAATCSCATARGSTWTWAVTPSTPPPKCDNITDLVIDDKAGERILEGLLVDADRRLREEGIAGDIYLFKNNTDSAGNLRRPPRELPGGPGTGSSAAWPTS